MRFCQFGIELERTTACRLSLCKRFISARVLKKSEAGAIGQSCERQSVIRIECYCASIQILGSIERFGPSLMKELASAQVVLVCANALSRNLLDRRFFLGSQHHFQRV